MKKNIKVLHFMRTYGVHGGEQQLSQLFGFNHNPETLESFMYVFNDPECEGLFSQRAPSLRQIILDNRRVRTKSAWLEFLFLLPLLPWLQWRFWRRLQNDGFDICVIHGFQAALISWPVAMLRRKTKWAYVHRVTKKPFRIPLIFKILYFPYNFVCGNSRAVTQSLLNYVNSNRLRTLDNGIDLANFDLKFNDQYLKNAPLVPGKLLICVGRLLPHKFQSLLLATMEILVAEHSDLYVWIVGNGSEFEKLNKIVERLNLSEKVFFLGQRSDVPGLLARADIFVNTSLWEGMSNSVLEAMAAGLPSIVVGAPGVSECHVHNVTGLIVEPTPTDLAKAIDLLLKNPGLARSLGHAARHRVELEYSIESNRRRYDSLYYSLVKG